MEPDARPRLDLDAVTLPLLLPEVPFPADRKLVDCWLGALGTAASASVRLAKRGTVPPLAVTGNTIFLAYRHYDLTGGIYAREQDTYYRPIRIGEALRVAGSIVTSYLKRGRQYRIMTSRTVDETDQTVVESTSTSVEQFLRQGADEQSSEVIPSIAAPTAVLDAGPSPCRDRLSCLVPGKVITGPETVVTLEMMQAQAGGDSRNPIHTDPEVARRAGLERPIAGGPHVLAYLQEAMMDQLGDEVLCHGAHFDVRWISPVATDTTVSPRATVEEVDARRVLFRLELDCDGALAMIGKAVVPIGLSPETSKS